MSAPTIGALRRRVMLETPQETPDGAGGLVRVYAPLVKIFVKIEAIGAQGGFVEQRQEQQATYRATLRWRADVVCQMRFTFSGRQLLIEAVDDPDASRRFLVCRCVEITP